FASHELGEFDPPRIRKIGYAQGKVTVGRRHRLISDFDADKVLVKFADHEAEQRFLHRHDDSLSLPGALARMQRGEDTAHHTDAGSFVANADGFGSRRSAIA